MSSVRRRREKIAKIIESKESIKISKLAEILDVSEMTIYRDLKLLGDAFFLSKGNITYKSDKLSEFPYYSRIEKNKTLKIAIASEAIKYINNNDTIFLDGSSTVGYLAKEIINSNFSLTIATISPIISIELARSDNIRVLCPGGLLDNINFIYNCEIEHFLENININKAFISCGAFSLDNGFTDLTIGESKIKNTVVKKISEVNVLVDHSKINNTYSYTWANYDEVRRLIIDCELDKDNLNILKSRKPEIILGEVFSIK